MLRLTITQARRLGVAVAELLPGPARTRRSGKSMPDDLLWAAVHPAYPEAVREFPNAVPGRRFRIDIALPTAKIALEVDGWEYHGKHRKAHQADRERQNLLVQNGWCILRFTAGQIHKDLPAVLTTIAATVATRAAPPPLRKNRPARRKEFS